MLASTENTSRAAAQWTFLACPGFWATSLPSMLRGDILDLFKNIPFSCTVRTHCSLLRVIHKSWFLTDGGKR